MDQNLSQKAISEALAGNWNEASNINKKILKEEPKNVDALNRLARAFAELGEIEKAKKTAKRVLKIDPFNTIALKAIKKWSAIKSSRIVPAITSSSETFLEDPGKTKIIALLYLGDPSLISKLDSGDELKFACHAHRVSVTTADGKYIGRLSDDLSAKLRRLIEAGNEYQVLVKSIDSESVKIFVREIKRCKKFQNTPSFAPEKINYVSFTPPELVRKKTATFIFPEEKEET
jgi:tetratricopeptide (TPR) repeat protein